MKYIYQFNLYKCLLLLVVGMFSVFQLRGQTTESYDDNPSFNNSSKDFTLDDFRYQITGTNSTYLNRTDNNYSFLSDSGPTDYAIQFDYDSYGGISSIEVSLSAGGSFDLRSLTFDVIANSNFTISSSEGGNVSFASNNSYLTKYDYDFSSEIGFNNITSFTISGGNLVVDFDDLTYNLSAANTPPTASSFTAANGPYENLTYTFSTSDFGYSDSDGDALDHVLIESLPTVGTLYLDADNDDVFDGGEAVNVSDQISKANLDAGNLQYIQTGSTNTSFQFDVSDGTDASTSNYTANLNVSPVPTVTLSVNPTSRPENQATANTITATLSNSYGINTIVNLSIGGTATNSVDYTISGSAITIPAGSTTGTVTLQNINDSQYENNETVIIDINSITGGTEDGTQQVTYTIMNDDIPPNASLEILDFYNPITNEAGGQAYVRGKIDNFAGVTVSIPLYFSGTATGGGTDYSITGSVITISPGQLMDSIRVTSLFDGLEEGDETIIIDMNTPTNAIEDGTQQVTLTIKDANLSPPTGYSVAIDQVEITAANQAATSFTFSGAEVGATYNYTFSSDGGGTNVTGSGSIATATDQITGIDLSGLGDGTITLSVTLTDTFGSTGSAATDTETKDTTAPTGYSVAIDQSGINTSNQSAASFTFAGAEVGTTYNYTLSSSGGGTNVTGSGTIATATDQISGIDLSGLVDGTITLSVILTDTFGNAGSAATDTETKDIIAPSGYTVSIDQSPINNANQSTTSFTFAGAEVGSTYNYTFSSSGGGTNVIGSGTITTAMDQITGLDLSGLGDGTVTLSVTLTDTFGNAGNAATDTETKDTTAPSGYTVSIDQSPINNGNQSSVSFTLAGAEVGSTYNYTFSSSGGGTNVTGSGTIATATDQIAGLDLSGLGDGTVTLSVTLTDTFGNTGSAATDTEAKDATSPSGYSVQIDQTPISSSNQSAVSFTFAGAEIGASYNYTLSSSGGGTNVTGSGSIATATDQITGIDLSGLGDGTVTLSVTLTDTFGNTGAAATDTETKDTTAPTGYSVNIDLLGEIMINMINETIIEFSGSGMEVGSTLNYSFTSSGGGSAVTGTETVTTASETFDNGGPGYDLSGLNDGTITLTVSLTDPVGNQGTNATDTETKDAGPPTGYSVSWDDNLINATESSSTSFSLTNAEVGTTASYSISSSGDGNTATVTGTVSVSNTSQTVTVDVGALTNGVLTVQVTLRDQGGNTGSTESDNSAVLDKTAPSGYVATFDQDPINGTNETAVSFSFTGAEVGAIYSFTISSSGGGTNISGSGTVATASDQITGIDLSGLGDGTITLSVSLSDAAGNTGSPNTDTSTKDTNEAPTASALSISGALTVGEQLTGNYTFMDPDSDPENGSSYKWYRSDDNAGTNKTAISGAIAQQYTLQAVDQGKYISFEVTPNDGTEIGTTVESALNGPVKVDQAITFPSIANKTYGDASFTLGDAQTDESLTVTYTADDPSVVSITGNQAIILKAGTTQITATQSGDGVTNAAPAVVQSLTVNKAALTVTGNDKSKVYGSTDPTWTVSYSGFVNGDNETALGGTLDLSRAAGEDVGNYAISASGYTSSNYTISYVEGNFEITQAALTVTADDKSKVYGSTDPTLTVSYAGFVNGDDETALVGTLDVSRAVGEDVGNYAVMASGYSSSNYTISYVDGNFEITQAALTVTADNISKVYGSADPSLTVSYAGFVNGDDETALGGTLDVSRAVGEDVGNYAVMASGYTSSNYTISYVEGNLEITQAALTVTADDKSKVYGSTDPTWTVSYSGFVNGDDETSLGGTLDVSRAAGEDVGNYVIMASGHTSSNYSISYVEGNFEITQAALTVTADDKSKVYGSTDPGFTVSYAGFVNGDDATDLGGTLDVSRAAGEDVGNYAIMASGYSSSNYTISYVDGNFEITQAALTVTADDKSKVYGSTDPGLTVSYAGFVNGDDATALGGTLAVSRAAGEDVGNYAISASGYTSSNYTISYVDGNFEITQAALTVTADDKSKVYGSTDPALTVSYAGFVNGDDETALVGTLDLSRAVGEDVGNYAISVSGYTSSNYTISYVEGNLEITQAALTVTADDKSKVYGSTDPGLTVSYAGFVNGDGETTLVGTLDLSRAAGEDVGNYAVMASGYSSSNYTISYVEGNLEITQAALTVTADDKSKVYGSTDPSLTVSYAGFVNGDDETALVGTLDLSRAAGEDVGNYTVTASGLISSNYTISYVGGNFEITQAALTVTADNKSKVYGSAEPSLTVSYSGFVNGDNEDDLGGTLAIGRTKGEDVGNYAISASGYTSSNYTIIYVEGNFEITQAALTVTADDKSKVYGSTDPGLTVSYAGFVNGDDETALGGTLDVSRAVGEDVGNYAISASGYASSNYTISYVEGNLEITQAALTVTADDKSKVYGSTDPGLTVSYAGFVNGDDETALVGTLDLSRAAGEDVGNYAVMASGYSSSNYTISYIEGNLEITQAALTVTADDKSKVYGSTDPSLTVSYAGFVNGDDATALGGTLDVSRAAGEDVGNYAISASGYSSSNYTINYMDGSLEITPEALTVVADDKSKVYGTIDPALTYVVSGLVNGDGMEVIVGNLNRSPGEEVGSYPINRGSLSTSANYLLQFTGGELTIEARKIEEVYEPAAVEVAWGVSYDEVILPETVLVRTEEDEMINLPVSWDKRGIDLRNRGTYTVTGELVLPSSVSEDAPSPYMDVVVLPKPAPSDLLLDNTEFEASVENIQIAIGGLEVIDPADDVHTIGLVSGAGDNQYFILSGSALYWNSTEALAGRTSFTVVFQVMDADGNILEKSFTITRLRKSLDEIEIYNTFTPNQDGTNDTWGIEELKYYTGVRIMVFERSGKRVFLTTDPEARWDGTFNGKELAPGSYFWVVETGETDKVRRGTLNLLRR
ncbi:gliding motility-associated C-terminal domain-containing protein [Echinicola sp. CAU 1574]|uniref:Gliding motility-associated C-terminal domain-containing protein n=1 Tax=Echinicola arenosa TaxID=2774144 RepID=A0ABR9AFG9_9BACT|nr:MBG domain-containing protein [Echinicola arenosa]MBD8487375.1 gliding motility-associated C-terminal domain-containing protein [Echinicola arenosa]